MAAHGVRMAVHQHMGTVVQSAADVDRLIENTGAAVGLLVDTGHLTYAGDDNVMQRVIGQGEQVDLNLRGWEAFSVPPTTGGQNVLQLLDQIATDLQSGNRAALGNADLQGVDDMLEQLSAARAQVGARTNRLETQQTRLKDTELNVEDLLSKTEDALEARELARH